MSDVVICYNQGAVNKNKFAYDSEHKIVKQLSTCSICKTVVQLSNLWNRRQKINEHSA